MSLWHKRLWHAPMKVLQKNNSLPHVPIQDHHCTVCLIAKQSRLPFPHSTSCSAHPFELVHVDVWEPYRVPTYDGKRYFMTLVDDFSKYTWLFLMNTKAESTIVLKMVLTLVQTQFDYKFKCLMSDNGIEFFNEQVNSFLVQHGIIHQSSCVYTPQHNSKVERKHRSILNMARALRFQAFVPLQFRGECVSTTVYLLNRLPIVLLKGTSHFEKLYNKVPSLQHLRIFGSLCNSTSARKADKFSPKAIHVVHLAYYSMKK